MQILPKRGGELEFESDAGSKAIEKSIVREKTIQTRINTLKQEEDTLIKRFNKKKSEISQEEAKLDTDIAEKRKNHTKEIEKMSNEVKSLEARKREALKPVKNEIKRLDKIDQEQSEREKALNTRSEQIDALYEQNMAFYHELLDREQLIKEQENDIADKWDKLKTAQEQNKRQATKITKGLQELSVKILDFNKEYSEKNAELRVREQSVKATMELNEKKDKELSRKLQRINSQLASLEYNKQKYGRRRER